MPTLRTVNPGERAPRKKMTVVQAANRGTHQDLLNALRLRIAGAIEDPKAHPRDLAPLSRQLLEISEALQATTTTAENDQIGQAAKTPDEPWQAV